MSAIFGPVKLYPCANCGTESVATEAEGECAVCAKLGDRSLVRFLREIQLASSDEERAALRARFDAARGRSWNFAERAVMRDL